MRSPSQQIYMDIARWKMARISEHKTKGYLDSINISYYLFRQHDAWSKQPRSLLRAHLVQLATHYSDLVCEKLPLLFIKPMRLSVLNHTKDNDHRCENCIYADPDSGPETYAARALVVGGIIFGCGMAVFGNGYLRAGESRYAGFLICLGWIIQFAGVGLILLGILALT